MTWFDTDKGVQRQTFVAIIATLGAMSMGTVLGWSSPAMVTLRSAFSFPITDDDSRAYGSVFGVGAAIGAIPAGYVSRVIGRRYGMALCETFVMAGWLCLTVPKAVWTLIAGRVLQGIGVGALCTIIPAYVGEISQPEIRGSLGAIFQVFVVIGILYAYVIGAYVEYVTFNIFCGFWTVIHVIGVLFVIPESPYFWLYKNRYEEATASMARLRDAACTLNTTTELATLNAEIHQQKNQRKTFSKLMSNKANRKSLLIGIGCMFFQQVSGINIVIFYMSHLFNLTGSHGQINAQTSSITVAVIQIVMTFVALTIIDKVGRRILLIWSAVLMGLSFACLAGCYVMIQKNIMFIDYLPLICISIYISAFSLGFGPVPWVVMGEIFSTEIKPYGTSLATATNWMLVFVVTYLSHVVEKSMEIYSLFIICSAFCLLAAAFVWFVVPETNNKSLAEIQTELAGGGNRGILVLAATPPVEGADFDGCFDI